MPSLLPLLPFSVFPSPFPLRPNKFQKWKDNAEKHASNAGNSNSSRDLGGLYVHPVVEFSPVLVSQQHLAALMERKQRQQRESKEKRRSLACPEAATLHSDRDQPVSGSRAWQRRIDKWKKWNDFLTASFLSDTTAGSLQLNSPSEQQTKKNTAAGASQVSLPGNFFLMHPVRRELNQFQLQSTSPRLPIPNHIHCNLKPPNEDDSWMTPWKLKCKWKPRIRGQPNDLWQPSSNGVHLNVWKDVKSVCQVGLWALEKLCFLGNLWAICQQLLWYFTSIVLRRIHSSVKIPEFRVSWHDGMTCLSDLSPSRSSIFSSQGLKMIEISCTQM